MSNLARSIRILNPKLSSLLILVLMCTMLIISGTRGSCQAGDAPAPASALFIIGSGSTIDSEVVKALQAQGIQTQAVSETEPLTAEYLRQFATVVLVSIDSYDGGGYYAPGGSLLANTVKNIDLVHQYVADGGGVIVVPHIGGYEGAATYANILKPWKMKIACETIRDPEHQLSADSVYRWTKNVTDNPITEGVKSLLYPTTSFRWDDQYGSYPLLPGDPAWTVLVRGENSSQGMRSLQANTWEKGDGGVAPAMAAVRTAGKGRVAVFGLSSIYLVTNSFSKGYQVGEMTTGPLEGIVYRDGDGKTTSDWGKLFANAIHWTAAAGVKAGFGGKPEPWVTKLPYLTWAQLPNNPVPDFAVIDWKAQPTLPSWATHTCRPVAWRGRYFFDDIPDPRVTAPQQMNRVLIGARSTYSDGSGTVAEWAAATKAAGYSVLVFTERFENFTPAKWEKFIAECQDNSTDDFVCLQGLDIADSYGNRFLIMGNENFPTPKILTADGKALQETQRLSLGFARQIVALHRPGTSALNPELARHFQAISVYTYANKENGNYGVVDDGYPAYQWQLKSSSNPVPIVVHELTAPNDVATKGTLGFQLIIPSQNAYDTAQYFRAGIGHFFEDPQRYFITEGPIIDSWSIFNREIGLPELNRDHFRAQVGASSPDPATTISNVVLYDRDSIARRWTPNTVHFSETVDGEHGYQRYYMMVVTDSKGRRAISPHLRTVDQGYYTRCGDRQNFFGAALQYTGIWPGSTSTTFFQPAMPVAGYGEVMRPYGGAIPGNNMANKLQLPFASNSVTFTDMVIDERYRTTTQYGMDAWQLHNTVPNRTYELRATVSKWHDMPTGIEKNDDLFKELSGVDVTMRSRMPIQPTNALFPVILTTGGSEYQYFQDGKMIIGKLDGKAETILDLPAGTSMGIILLLTPMAVSGKGEIGWRADTNQLVPAWSEWKTSYMYVPLAWRSTLGADGPTPWSMNMAQGKLNSTLGCVNLIAERNGVSGTLKAGGEVKNLPLRVSGLNANWPAALWTPGKHLMSHTAGGSAVPRQMVDVTTFPGLLPRTTFLNHIGVYEGIGYASLDNTADTSFYVGNTLMSSNPAIILAHTIWTRDEAGIEVNNPTNAPVSTHISSPAEITDYCHIDCTVTVPAGTTIRLKFMVEKDAKK